MYLTVVEEQLRWVHKNFHALSTYVFNFTTPVITNKENICPVSEEFSVIELFAFQTKSMFLHYELRALIQTLSKLFSKFQNNIYLIKKKIILVIQLIMEHFNVLEPSLEI